MKPLIKWPGGKGRLIRELTPMVSRSERYLEPFLGGGALFFSQEPQSSKVNDLSSELVGFYRCVQRGDEAFLASCHELASLFFCLGRIADENPEYRSGTLAKEAIEAVLPHSNAPDCIASFLDAEELEARIESCLKTATRRTTAARAAFYYLARDEYNAMVKKGSFGPYASALFFMLRELCFGSMFRYNSTGGFNIPYGGFSYDRKNLGAKVQNLVMAHQSGFFLNSEISNQDFRLFFKEARPTEGDFIFLDPPYDSSFSDYSGNSFTRADHLALRDLLASTKAHFLLVVGRTSFIEEAYRDKAFIKRSIPSNYSYSMLGRNDRKVDYLIINNK